MTDGGLPLTGHESVEELAARYFPSPAVYTFSWGRFMILVTVPLLLPLGSALMAGPRPLTILLTVAAVVLAGTTLLLRWPPRRAVRIDGRGIGWRGRTVPWRRVTGVVIEPPARGHSEPRALEIQVDGGPPIPLPEELAQTAEIRSLRNLGQLIEALAVAAREEEKGASPFPDEVGKELHHGENSVG